MKQVVLSIDGSTNVTSVGVVAAIALVPEPVFISCDAEKAVTKDADYYFKKYSKIMATVGTTKVVGTVNDNEATMKAAQKLLSIEYPWLINVGCFSHVLNLFAKNGIQTSASILEVVNVVKRGTKAIRRSSNVHGVFKSIQSDLKDDDSKFLALHIPGEYRSHVRDADLLLKGSVTLICPESCRQNQMAWICNNGQEVSR